MCQRARMARVRIIGTNGPDRLVERRVGESDIFGRAGNDTILLTRDDDQGGDNRVNAGPGNDRVANAFEGGNVIRMGPGNDLYVGAGFSAFNDRDFVDGGTGNDRFIVSTLQSVYRGGAGNDRFISEGFRNTFNGGPGSDTIDYSRRTLSSTFSDSPVTVDLSQGKAFTGAARFETLGSIENVTGTRLGDEITGNNGPNVLNGISGDDVIFGLAGNDRLLGGPGNDILAGDGGNDVLIGGPGRDGFVFRAEAVPDNADVITDFSAAEDVIGLSGAIFPVLPLGPLDGSRLALGTSATNPDQRVIYDRVTGQVFFDGDGSDTAQEAVLIVTLPNQPELQAANFEMF